jgi:hypothetical protein
MLDRRSLIQVLDSATGGLPVPALAKAGAAVMAIGLLLDVVVHTVLHSVHDVLIGSFPLGEHLAHLVVVVGMALVLVGIVADGLRSQRRQVRQEGNPRHAVR